MEGRKEMWQALRFAAEADSVSFNISCWFVVLVGKYMHGLTMIIGGIVQ